MKGGGGEGWWWSSSRKILTSLCFAVHFVSLVLLVNPFIISHFHCFTVSLDSHALVSLVSLVSHDADFFLLFFLLSQPDDGQGVHGTRGVHSADPDVGDVVVVAVGHGVPRETPHRRQVRPQTVAPHSLAGISVRFVFVQVRSAADRGKAIAHVVLQRPPPLPRQQPGPFVCVADGHGEGVGTVDRSQLQSRK